MEIDYTKYTVTELIDVIAMKETRIAELEANWEEIVSLRTRQIKTNKRAVPTEMIDMIEQINTVQI